ncbi:actin-like protein [Scheffersomyces xylosifermentans]|uniref:actin-like protein n=1 Tax=Scheffersomyces xylosifermentans TaxID=1304137 RepID=UPI00315CB44A
MSRSASNEYSAVILTIGPRLVSVGKAGDSLSQSIQFRDSCNTIEVDDNKELPGFLELDDFSLSPEQQDVLFHNSITNSSDYDKLSIIYTEDKSKWCPINIPNGLGERSEAILHKVLIELIIERTDISPRDMKVFLIDNGFSALVKFQIFNILLNKLKFRAVILQPESVLSIIASNKDSGLVVDIGWNSAKFSPVIDVRDLTVNNKYEYSRQWNGVTLHYLMLLRLIELNDDIVNEMLLSRQDLFDIIENFIMTCVFVRPIDGESSFADSSRFEILEDVFIPNKLRYEVVESMFFGENSIIQPIKSIIKETNIDNRVTLLRNVVVTGDVPNIKGFKFRLSQELKKTFDDKVTTRISLGPWVGCSLYVSSILSQLDKSQWKRFEITRDSMKSLQGVQGYRLSGLPDYQSMKFLR